MPFEIRQCVICGQDQASILFRPKHSPGPVVYCQQCEFVYVSVIENNRALIQEGPVLGRLDPGVLTSSNLDDISDSWELSLLPSKESEWPAIHLNATAALDRIEQYVQPLGSLLDFGCGWGFFLGVAKKRGWKIYGLEPLSGHAVYARAKFGATVVTDTLHEDTFPSNSFDAITAFQVFEHLPDPAGDLVRLHHLLKPEGVILIEVPNIDTWSVKLLGVRHRHFVKDHLNFFSAHTLRLLLEKQGFEVLNIYYPARRMTIHHLIGWGGRYLPKRAISLAQTIFMRLGLWDRIVGINLGDIVTVIARKIQ